MSSSKSTRNVFDYARDTVDQVVVAELAVMPTLELVERSVGRIVGDPVLKLAKAPDKLLDADLAGGLPKELVVEVLDPLVVSVRDARVPSIAQVELDRHDVARAALRSFLRADVDSGVLSGIQCPFRIDAVELWRLESMVQKNSHQNTHIDDISDVVHQRDVDIQACGDEPGRLKEVIVVLFLRGLRGSQLVAL